MADFRAIAGVTHTLQTLLLDRMELPDSISAAPVTSGTPPYSAKDLHPHMEQPEDPRLNLFLYRVTENGYLQNQEMPGRGNGPAAFGHPPLSLNLHYLLTPYGNTEEAANSGLFDDNKAQCLLGSAMRVFHDVPIVTETLLTQRPVSGRMILDDSLRGEFEHVKVTLEPVTLEDVTKVWTALGLRYRLSGAYIVNVVQIESRRPRTFAKPVGRPISPTIPPLPTDPPSPGPWVYALTIQTPSVTDVAVRRAGTHDDQPFPYASVLDTIVLKGTSLSGRVTRVAFGDVIVPATLARGDRVEATIPDDVELQPGVRTARVIVSDPLVPQSQFMSNDAPFMLVPWVKPPAIVYQTVGLPASVKEPPRRLQIDGTRLIGPMPGGETVIGRSAVERADYLGTPTPIRIVVPIPDTLPANGVQALIGAPLAGDPTIVDGELLTVTIAGDARSIAANMPGPATTVPLDQTPAFLAGMIHDVGLAQPATATHPQWEERPGFVDARTDLYTDAAGSRSLVVLPGGLTRTLQISSPAGSGVAKALGFDAAVAGFAVVTDGAVSGELTSPPPLSSPAPQLTVTMGGQAPITITLAKPASLASLAADLEAKIKAAGGTAAYTAARVVAIDNQLLFAPGAAGIVTFGPTPGDSTTVAELQLNAKFAVRVRVNNAESLDTPPPSAAVLLPQ